MLTMTMAMALTYIPDLTLTFTYIILPQVNMSCQSKGPYDFTFTYVPDLTLTNLDLYS
jgi:hypothetical protein